VAETNSRGCSDLDLTAHVPHALSCHLAFGPSRAFHPHQSPSLPPFPPGHGHPPLHPLTQRRVTLTDS